MGERLMGFEFEGNIYTLEFQTPTHWGLEVRCTSVPIGQLRRLIGMAVEVQAAAGQPQAKRKFTPAQAQALEGLISGFADALVSWNLERKGVPVPATQEGLDEQPFEFLYPVITAWFDAVGGVAEESDLGKGSPSGVIFPESSLPMAPRSPSLGSLMTPS
ncbi:MAG: hypothetical protein ACRDQ0_12645 [Pseudonocardia sp.]